MVSKDDGGAQKGREYLMPLSKQRNKDGMRLIRLHKQSLSPQRGKSVQPMPVRPTIIPIDIESKAGADYVARFIEGIDADGNVIPDE